LPATPSLNADAGNALDHRHRSTSVNHKPLSESTHEQARQQQSPTVRRTPRPRHRNTGPAITARRCTPHHPVYLELVSRCSRRIRSPASPKSVRGAGRPARSRSPRAMHEDARDVTRRKMTTKAFLKSGDRGSWSRCALGLGHPEELPIVCVLGSCQLFPRCSCGRVTWGDG
jgi:hypothetical protein